MNTDIRLSVGFWQHPKTFRIEKKLGLKGIRSLQILWRWRAQNRPQGDLVGFDEMDIEFVADWRGKKGLFVEACLETNWIELVEGGYRLHEWSDYNPWQAQATEREEARKEKARNAANIRWRRERSEKDADNATPDNAANNACNMLTHNSGNATSNAKNMLKQCLDDATSNAQEMPSLPVPEEEFKSIKASADPLRASAEQASALSLEIQIQKKPDPCVFQLPIVGSPDCSTHKVFQSDIDKYREPYPAADIPQQFRFMLGWLEANPSRRKTKNGVKSFIHKWLKRAQDEAPPKSRADPRHPAEAKSWLEREDERNFNLALQKALKQREATVANG